MRTIYMVRCSAAFCQRSYSLSHDRQIVIASGFIGRLPVALNVTSMTGARREFPLLPLPAPTGGTRCDTRVTRNLCTPFLASSSPTSHVPAFNMSEQQSLFAGYEDFSVPYLLYLLMLTVIIGSDKISRLEAHLGYSMAGKCARESVQVSRSSWHSFNCTV